MRGSERVWWDLRGSGVIGRRDKSELHTELLVMSSSKS